MKSFVYLLLLTVILSVSLFGCYYDKAELLYPSQAACDTTNVTFKLSVQPIFTANCVSCHSTANAASFGGGVKLQEYSDVNTNKNQAYDAIINGRMPKNGGKLDKCSIDLLRIWISSGAPNN